MKNKNKFKINSRNLLKLIKANFENISYSKNVPKDISAEKFLS